MSVRDDPVLFLQGSKAGAGAGTVSGGAAITTTRPHKLDGPEHNAADDTTRLDASTTRHGLLPKLPGTLADVLRGDGTWAGALASLHVISPAQLVANIDNWNPTGLATAEVIRVSTDASRNLTGIVAATTARPLVLANVGAQDLVLKHDTTSTAANRFYCPADADVTVPKDSAAWLLYDLASARWRVVGVSVTFATPAVSYGTPATGAASTAIRTDATLLPPPTLERPMANKSGASVAAGDVVVLSAANADAFTTTTVAQSTLPIGVALESIADNATGRVAIAGYVASVNTNGSTFSLRTYLETNGSAKQATTNGARRTGSFGVILGTGANPPAVLFGVTDAWATGGGGGGSLTIEEVDGSPSVAATKLVLPNGTLGVVGTVATYTPAGGGGGGASTTVGPVASRPGSGTTAGDTYRCTDAPYTYVWTGSAWQAFVAGMAVTEPALGDFTQVEVGDCTFDTTHGGIIISKIGGSTNTQVLAQAIPGSGAYYVDAAFMVVNTGNNGGSGSGFSGGLATTDKLAYNRVGWESGTSWHYEDQLMNSVSSFNGNRAGTTVVTHGPLIWTRAYDDRTTNRKFYLSNSGYNWLLMDTDTRTNLFTPAKAVFAVSFTAKQVIHLVHFSVHA